MRTKNFVAIVIANFFLVSLVAENNKIDSVLILLKNSLQEKGKSWNGDISHFKKVERPNETICYLYPEFMYSCQNGESPCARTRITIHFIKNEFIRKDTFFYSGVYGQEKFAILTNAKIKLRENSYFIEIETPVGDNNAYYQTKKMENAVKWMSYILCTDNSSTENRKSKLYDTDMQMFMGINLFFKGIYSSKK